MAESLSTDQRGAFICRATYAIEPMLEALRKMAASGVDTDMLPWMVLGIVPRLQQLNYAVMSAGHESCTAEDLREAGLLDDDEVAHD